MAAANLTSHRREVIMHTLIDSIARDSVPLRPNRSQTRAPKRRPQNYQLLSKHGQLFKETQHRNG